jgi:hypothetical protein
MRFCKDCTHYVGQNIGPEDVWYERCMRPVEPVYNLVSGEAFPAKHVMPSDERYNLSKSACGVDAQFFEWKVKATEVMDAGASIPQSRPPESSTG